VALTRSSSLEYNLSARAARQFGEDATASTANRRPATWCWTTSDTADSGHNGEARSTS